MRGDVTLKIGTLLKAGSLALDIFNHQSTRQLSGLVSNGIKRRGFLQQGNAAPQGGGAAPAAATRNSQSTGARQPQAAASHPARQQEQWPNLPVKQALKYVTPDTMKKAMQWHGIIKSFIEKD